MGNAKFNNRRGICAWSERRDWRWIAVFIAMGLAER
jgi:hypothetical protein